MTYEEVAKDNDRFATYLRANGKRVVASLLLVADDHDNSESTVYSGGRESITILAIRALALNAGYKLEPL